MSQQPMDAKTRRNSWLQRFAAIDSRKRLEEDLGIYEAIITSSDDAIVSKTLEGIITSWNQAAEQMFGYSAHEAIGQPITLIIPTELWEEEQDIIGKLRRGIPIKHFETVRIRKDGTRIDVSLSISPVKNRAGKIIGAAKIARDITARKELERRKDEFISTASHELKTPITVLKTLAQILRKKCEREGMQQVVPHLHKLETQVDRLTRLVNELLDASKIQAGRLNYDEEPVDLAALVRETVELLRPTSTTHTLLLSAPSQAWVVGDKDRLGQVLINLISNAIKYSPEADSVEISLTSSDTTVTLSVRDHGMGIPEALQQNIFERFYRATDFQTKDIAGLGLGLYISSEIVKRHGGKILVESEEGQGATFTVSLPRDTKSLTTSI